jgi:hypothetical protein
LPLSRFGLHIVVICATFRIARLLPDRRIHG